MKIQLSDDWCLLLEASDQSCRWIWLSYFISGSSPSLLYREKKFNMWPFPADITYLWTVLAIILWRNLKNNISEFYLTGLPASFKLPVRKQQSSSGPIASDYLTCFPPLLYFFPITYSVSDILCICSFFSEHHHTWKSIHGGRVLLSAITSVPGTVLVTEQALRKCLQNGWMDF